MKNSRVFKHQNKYHFVLGSNTEVPDFVTSDWEEVEMNEFPVKTARSGVEGPAIAPQIWTEFRAPKDLQKKPKRPTNLHGRKKTF